MCQCCVYQQNPQCYAITGLVSNIVSLGFLIWSVVDVPFSKNVFKTLYTLSVILLCVSLVLFICLIVFVSIKRSENHKIIYTIGIIFCIIILIISYLVTLFVLSSFIKVMKDYYDIEKLLPGRQIPIEYYCAAIIPFIICIGATCTMNAVLYPLIKVFKEYKNPSIFTVGQNTTTTIGNVPQPGIFPNNNGPVPPMENTDYQTVTVQQNENNINK